MNQNQKLIAELRKRQRAAGQKVSRLRRSGIDIEASGIDPRIPLSQATNLSPAKMRDYIKNLNTFTSRETSFVPGHKGIPLSGKKFAEFNREAAKLKRKRDKIYDEIKNITLLNQGVTIEERDRDIRPKRVKAAGEAVNRPLDFHQFSSKSITSNEALDKMIESLKNKNSKGYLQHEIFKQRYQALRIAQRLGDEQMYDSILELSEHQFMVLWNYSTFATEAGLAYENMVSEAVSERKDRFAQESEGTQAEMIRDLLSWAKNDFESDRNKWRFN